MTKGYQADHGTVDFPFGRRAKPSLIHIHINHDLFRGRDFFFLKSQEQVTCI